MRPRLPYAARLFILTGVAAWGYPLMAAHAPDTSSFFPLAIGNHWTYGSIWDTTLQFECRVFDTARVNGLLYYLHSGGSLDDIDNSYPPVDTVRLDTLGRLWRYEGGKEYMLFDFTHGNYASYTTYPEVDTVIVNYLQDTTVPAGRFTVCVDLYFRRSFNDESVGFIFARGVGIVEKYGPFLLPSVLLRAVVNGRLISSVRDPSVEFPSRFQLEQNYPNPFNPATRIRLTIAHRQLTIVDVYDVLGRKVTTLLNETKDPGTYNVVFDAGNLASGVYLCRMTAGNFVQVVKMVVVR